MAGTHDLYPVPAEARIDRPCRGCGQVYQYRPSIGSVMLGPCDHCAEGIPGVGTWGLEDGSPRWRLSDNDAWQTLTPSQVRLKDAEERVAIEAVRRRRSLN